MKKLEERFPFVNADQLRGFEAEIMYPENTTLEERFPNIKEQKITRQIALARYEREKRNKKIGWIAFFIGALMAIVAWW